MLLAAIGYRTPNEIANITSLDSENVNFFVGEEKRYAEQKACKINILFDSCCRWVAAVLCSKALSYITYSQIFHIEFMKFHQRIV